jgi:hypothetical protein
MRKEDLSIDITFNHCYFSLDSPFKAMGSFVSLKNVSFRATNWIKSLRFDAMNGQTFFGLQNFEAIQQKNI